jgi:hypothetical protein
MREKLLPPLNCSDIVIKQAEDFTLPQNMPGWQEDGRVLRIEHRITPHSGKSTGKSKVSAGRSKKSRITIVRIKRRITMKAVSCIAPG